MLETRRHAGHQSIFPEKLLTKRTILRRIALSDAAGWKSFNNQIAKRMAWPGVPSVVYARNEILHYDEMWEHGERYVYIILERGTDKVIGDFHLKAIDKARGRAEFGHALHPRTWGTGITHETLDAVKRAAQRAGLTLWAKVEVENIRSWKSLEKHKAKYIGTKAFSLDGQRKRMRVYEL